MGENFHPSGKKPLFKKWVVPVVLVIIILAVFIGFFAFVFQK